MYETEEAVILCKVMVDALAVLVDFAGEGYVAVIKKVNGKCNSREGIAAGIPDLEFRGSGFVRQGVCPVKAVLGIQDLIEFKRRHVNFQVHLVQREYVAAEGSVVNDRLVLNI